MGGEAEKGIKIFNKIPKILWDLMILPRLSLKDLILFGAVCPSWRSIAAEIQCDFHRLPWLMISRDPKTNIGIFLSLSDNKIYHLSLPELILESFCCGFSQGFLTVSNLESNFLFNPFSQIRIDLPKQYVPPDHRPETGFYNRYFFNKVLLHKTNSQYVVSALSSDLAIIEMCTPDVPEWAIFGAEKVEYEKSSYSIVFLLDEEQEEEEEEEEEEEVKQVEEKQKKDDNWLFSDILYYNGMLYGLTRANGLVTFELQQDIVAHTILKVQPMSCPTDIKFNVISSYLVESCGELLMVYRFRNYSNEHKMITVTRKFLVFRLDQSSELLQWVQLQSLGDQILFLGRNSSLSISATGIPGFKGNSIYFTDDMWPYFSHGNGYGYCNSDNGVFYLEDGHVGSLSVPDHLCVYWHPSVWVTPNSLLAHKWI